MNQFDAKLAVVIPAFKAKFLAETLNSIASQTSKQFKLYIFDDCSPEPIKDIAKSFEGTLSFAYKRFEKNLGGISLVKQWERCIALTTEEWIWLFSDDDIMEANCVEAFYNTLNESNGKFDVYRFNAVIINEQGKKIALNPPHPPEENCFEFLYFYLKGLRASMMQDHIFSRRAYKIYSGFPNYPLAWCADQAQVLRLGLEKGFSTILKSNIRFRQSGFNISSSKQKSLDMAKANAAMLFIEWLLDFIDNQKEEKLPVSKNEIKQLAQEWLKGHLMALHAYFGPKDMINAIKFFQKNWNDPLWLNSLQVLKMNIHNLNNQIRKYLKS